MLTFFSKLSPFYRKLRREQEQRDRDHRAYLRRMQLKPLDERYFPETQNKS